MIHPFKISSQLVTNGEWKEFIEANGYQDPTLWLMDGFAQCEKKIGKLLYIGGKKIMNGTNILYKEFN
jgi:Uncharacterized conserved protein